MTIYEKILNVQSELGAIVRDTSNPFFKSKYFDVNTVIATLKPLLIKHGLVVLQPLSHVGERPALVTQIIDTTDGQTVMSECLLPDNADAQKMGAIITYFRRYSLVSMFLIEGEDDDDANSASPVAQTAPKSVYNAPAKVTPVANPTQCAKCDSPMVLNPKTGKAFCKSKCWLAPVPTVTAVPDDEILLADIPF